MESLSHKTQNPDAYEAGLELAEALGPVNPEVILLFCSIHYNLEELFSALYTGLNKENVLIFGGTGDGVYCSKNVDNIGVTALAINSNKLITWEWSLVTNANIDTFNKAHSCAKSVLEKLGQMPQMSFVLSSLTCDGVEVVNGIKKVISTPFIGGLTGDDWQFKEGYIFINGEIHSHSIAILSMIGKFHFTAHTASGWKTIGIQGTITSADHTSIKTINSISTFDFIEAQLGTPPAEAELGMLPLAAFDAERYYLRTPSSINYNDGSVTYFGSIPEGTRVQVCCATIDDILSGVEDVAESFTNLDFNPSFAIAVSCGARKWLLQDRISEEINRLQEKLNINFPLIGFASFGEIGPFLNQDKSYSPVYFHNVSFVLLLIG